MFAVEVTHEIIPGPVVEDDPVQTQQQLHVTEVECPQPGPRELQRKLDGPAAIIHGSALRMRFGGPDVKRGQLKHLLDMSELPNVTVRVIPFDTEYYPSTGQSFDYIVGPVPQLDTVQLDTHHGGCGFLDAEAQLSKYRAVLDHMESCALGPAESRDFIQSLIQDI